MRPYKRLRIDELEQLFASSSNNGDIISAIYDELSHRTTTRASELKKRAKAQLTPQDTATTNPIISANKAITNDSSVATSSPNDEVNSRTVDVTQSTVRSNSNQLTGATSPLLGPNGAPKVSSDSSESSVDHSANVAASIAAPSEAKSGEARPSSKTSESGQTKQSEELLGRSGVVQLLDYVQKLVELTDRPVWSVRKYGNLVLAEADLRDRVGIRHDLKALVSQR